MRDKNIEIFESNKANGLNLEDLVNIECIFASHNKIKDLFGISMLTTLVELNLNFNSISDITYIYSFNQISPLEELILLKKLWLNRNFILVIDPI